MERKTALTLPFTFFCCVLTTTIFTAAAAQAQEHRQHNQIMKDVGATFASLKKNLDANSAPAAAQDAAKLEGLFNETEAFWRPLVAKDALELAKVARDNAVAVAVATKNNDIKAAQASYSVIQKSCTGCHLSHREEIGSGFLIKP